MRIEICMDDTVYGFQSQINNFLSHLKSPPKEMIFKEKITHTPKEKIAFICYIYYSENDYND